MKLKIEMIKSCLILLLMIKVSSSLATDSCLSDRPLTTDLVKEIHTLTATTLIDAGLDLDSGNCVQAAALNSALLQMLGFREGRDFSLVSTHLHVHTFIPSTGQILDPTIAQFLLRTPDIARQVVSQRGFLGTKTQLLDFFESNFGTNAAGIARTGWRITRDSNEYLDFFPPQDAASVSAQQLAAEILTNHPQTLTGRTIRSALERNLSACDRDRMVSTEVSCSSRNSILETHLFEEVIFNQYFLRNLTSSALQSY